MKRLFLAFLLLLSSRVLAEDTTFYSVAYIEVKPSSRTQAIAALRGYRENIRRDDANIRLELFELLLVFELFFIRGRWGRLGLLGHSVLCRRLGDAAGGE